MGIPGLTRFLSPYALQTILGFENPEYPIHVSKDESQRRKVIIDGPALAHMVYRQMIASAPDQAKTLARIPTYDQIGERVLTLLQKLERYGVAMYGNLGIDVSLRISRKNFLNHY